MSREEIERKNRANFMRCFLGSDEGRMALRYLSDFCRAETAEFVPDARLADYLQGRRSVYCEILRLTGLGVNTNVDEL